MIRNDKRQEVVYVNKNKGGEMYHKKAPDGLKEKKKRTRSKRNIEIMHGGNECNLLIER